MVVLLSGGLPTGCSDQYKASIAAPIRLNAHKKRDSAHGAESLESLPETRQFSPDAERDYFVAAFFGRTGTVVVFAYSQIVATTPFSAVAMPKFLLMPSTT